MRRTYSEEFKRVLMQSRKEALNIGDKLIRQEHFILGMISEPNNSCYPIIQRHINDLGSLRSLLINKARTYAPDSVPIDMPSGAITLDAAAGMALQVCMNEADITGQGDGSMGDGGGARKVGSVHLLMALLKDRQSFVSRTLGAAGLTYDKLKDFVITNQSGLDHSPVGGVFLDEVADTINNNDEVIPDMGDERNSMYDQPGSTMRNPQSGTNNSSATAAGNGKPLKFLAKYASDFTALAKEKKLDPVVGRKNEIERVAQILCRRKKNNPILIGEAGVGKTAIVEGMAQRIVSGDVPAMLLDKRIMALDMPGVVAGTKFRGQFEERLQGIIKELQDHPEIILFIDEIHTIIGAGGAAGSMDAANMLKPALGRGKLQCIGATTVDEYRKSIEKDGALERRFQKVTVNAATPEETLEILNNIKGNYERHHNVTYTDKALQACVKLTERYISDRQLPDKAIDAMDEAGSRKHLFDSDMPESMKALEKEMSNILDKKDDAVNRQDYAEASRLRDEYNRIKDDFTRQKADWLEQLRTYPAVVDQSDVEQVVSVMSGVPVHKMAEKENVRLKELKSELKHTIIAQDKAIEKLIKAITRNRIGLRDPNKPIGTFMFLGPTGVGKTFLAKKLAEYMFGTEDALIRIDMSEYMERFSTSRLVGAPPGYVGYDEGGQLTEKVKRRPYSIVLLDEIEKANRDVFNILLQVMDEGRLTDSNGVTVDFRNTIIIMTSNCGSKDLQDFGNTVGFNMQSEEERKANSDRIIMKALQKQFAPEFINRIDDIILFDELDKNAISQIIDNELEKLNLRMTALGYTLELDKEAKAFLVEKSYDKKYGARPLKRAIQTYVEDGISDYLLDENNKPGEDGVIHITKKARKEEFAFG